MSELAEKGIFSFVVVWLFITLAAVGFLVTSSHLVYGEQTFDKEAVQIETIEDVAVVPPSPRFAPPEVAHVAMPEVVRAVYLTAWSAGLTSKQDSIIDFITGTEANAIVIDIKDDTGKIAFPVSDVRLQGYTADLIRIRDIESLIKKLHEQGIYVIGRIAVFQDPHFVQLHPEFAVHTADGSQVWQDRKGLTWIDAAAKPAWEYVAMLAEYSYGLGFDEINLDYIRYPTDGNMSDISYPMAGERPRREVMKEFFAYMDERLRGQGIPLSADVFGMTTEAADDLGIGQVFTDIVPHVDAIAPMIYPSHYPATYRGLANPASEPYLTIKYSMEGALAKLATIGESSDKLRPWLQDFNLGATYTAPMVRAQMQALYDLGIDSWMMWDPANTYTTGAYLAAE